MNSERRKTTAISLKVVDAINDLDGAKLTTISEYMNLHESTLYTHLKTLEESGYITKIDGEYHLGIKLFHLGKQARERTDYMLIRQKALEIAEKTNQQSSFSVEESGRILVLFDQSTGSSVDGFQVGEYYHMHNSACGKAILAEYSKSRVEGILDEWGLPKTQDNTITDREELFNELERTRERGYAINDQESLEGLRGIAVTVKDPRGEILGALDLFGPPYLLPSDEELAGTLASAVEDLTEEIRTAVMNEEKT
ncbi:IclR family transcriptional regulator [Haloferax sp. ATB1]|uniref:IclR family transcriptional regulator n=1 Tax=Haloferax sp. ATB1 TaxID=1508454 RepID=UPI0009E30E31|nr:IclR family transcriptional regulator [Haloferax sp. ATB1]